VKEDVISRIGELGVIIREGKIVFEPALLNEDEILEHKQQFEYFSLDGESQEISLDENELGFTLCQVPVVYTFSDENTITVTFDDDTVETIIGNTLDQRLSSLIFTRSGDINLVEVNIKYY
jgi:hypothetical protein